jgi:ankyrin repeat protein
MKHLLLTTIAAVVLVGCGPQPPDISIHKAAQVGNIEAVKQHLAAGTDVNAKDVLHRTPLQKAAVGGSKEIAELLIAADADVNAKDQYGGTPLFTATMFGHQEIVELLIENGADVNAKGKVGETPLHRAAQSGHKEIAELLITKGADVNAKRDGGDTPLDTAYFTNPLVNGSLNEIIVLLRKHGGKTKVELEPAGTTKGFDENSLPVSVAPATRAEDN